MLEANVVLDSDTAQYVGSTSGTKDGMVQRENQVGKQVKSQKLLLGCPRNLVNG